VTLLYAPATLRNREVILDVLRRVLPARGLVLELASGTGEHATHFAKALPGLVWQPSDPDESARESIAAWTAELGATGVLPPLAIDASAARWPLDRADAVVAINVVHISPWEVTLGLLAGAARLLPPGGPLYLYGPYRRDGRHTSPSNEDFDASLRDRDPRWGVRDLEVVSRAAQEAGFSPPEVIAMPANNLSLVFRRVTPAA
jgi:SAM-dependent methyltransferase